MSRPRQFRLGRSLLTAALLLFTLLATVLTGAPAAQAAPGGLPPAAAQAAAAAEPYSVLVFSKTAGFRHDSIPAGIAAIQQLGAANGFTVDATEDAAAFTDANLAHYATVDLAVHHRRRARRRPAGRVRALHPGRRRLRRRPRRVRHRVRLGLVRRPGRRVLRQRTRPTSRPRSRSRTRPTRPRPTCRRPWSRFDEWYNFQTNPRGDGARAGQPGRDAATRRAPARWAPTTRSPGARTTTAAGPGTPAAATPIESYADAAVPATTCSAASRPRPARSTPTARASLTGSFEKVTLDSNTSNPMELDIAPDGRVFYIERDGRVQIIKPDTGTTVTAIDLDVFTGNEDGLLGIRLDPDFATNNWVYLYYSPNDGGAAQPAVPVHRHRRHDRPRPARRCVLQVDHPAQHLLPRGRQHGLRQRRQPLPGHRRQHQPVRVRRLHADRRAGRPAGLRRAAHRRATPTTCAARCCGSTRRPTAPTPSRPATCSRRARRRPGPRSTRWASATRSGSASTRPTNTLYVADYGPDARRGQPEPGPGGHRRVEHRHARATTAGRTASARTTPTTTTRSRPARAGRSSTAPRRSTTRPTTPA